MHNDLTLQPGAKFLRGIRSHLMSHYVLFLLPSTLSFIRLICKAQKLPLMPKYHFPLSTFSFLQRVYISILLISCLFYYFWSTCLLFPSQRALWAAKITSHLAVRFGAFEFVQPNIQRLGSLHPTLLVLIWLDWSYRLPEIKLALPNLHTTGFLQHVYFVFSQLQGISHPKRRLSPWGYIEFPSESTAYWSGLIYS